MLKAKIDNFTIEELTQLIQMKGLFSFGRFN